MEIKFRTAVILLSFSITFFQLPVNAQLANILLNSKQLKDYNTDKQLISRGIPNLLLRALNSFKPKRIRVGSTDFSLSRNSMRHILTRHHPDYWDGSSRTVQTFFSRNTSIDDIENAIESVINQNRERLSRLGGNGTDTVEGIVNGITYVLRVDRGRIGSFYPRG